MSRRLRGRTRASRTAPRSAAERLLDALGAEPGFADAVLGDLAEEYALRSADEGARAARSWYVRELLRSAPHFVWSALRHPGPNGRARLAAHVVTYAVPPALAAAAALAVWHARRGPPARLEAGYGAEGVVVNNDQRAAQLPVRVLDAAGHALPDTGVRYRWESGAPFPVSPDGAVTCTGPGDAVVRAALGHLRARFAVHCLPVHALLDVGPHEAVLGDAPRALAVGAVDRAGRRVTRLAAWVGLADGTVATIRDGRVRPLRAGTTTARVDAGDHWAFTTVSVYEPVRTFAGLGPDQRFVAVRVRLAPGASVRYPLPAGAFVLASLPDPAALGADGRPAPGQVFPRLTLAGPVECRAAPGSTGDHAGCFASAPGATLTVVHPGTTAGAVVGTLALRRLDPRVDLQDDGQPARSRADDPAFALAAEALARRAHR